MSRVLVISSMDIGPAMLGPAIRSLEVARALGTHGHDVRLAATGGDAEVVYAHQDPRALAPHLKWADAVVCQPQWPLITRMLERSGARLIFDCYVPEPLELLETHARRRPAVRRAWLAFAGDRLADAARVGHHLVCASEGQRDLWLGLLVGGRALRPARYDADQTLRSVVDVVPFGVPETPFAPAGPGPRERFGLHEDDEIVLWNGGVWDWLDATTAVDAIAALRARRPRARLVFMGRSDHESAVRAQRELEERARPLGDAVLIPDAWTPYDARAAWLAQADCAVSLHVDHAETRFAFRTRLLDCLWAGLPIVSTEGDELSDLVEREGLGATVPQRDAAAVADALDGVLARGRAAYAEPLARAASAFEWPKVVRPVAAWADAGRKGLPPRLGGRRTLGHAARNGMYLAARNGLNSAGLDRWPGG